MKMCVALSPSNVLLYTFWFTFFHMWIEITLGCVVIKVMLREEGDFISHIWETQFL